jgi:hypothetical protein
VTEEPPSDRHSQSCLQTLFIVVVLFFSSFDEKMTELGLDAEELTESVLHLNLEIFCFYTFLFLFSWFFFFVLFFFPFDEITTELVLRHQHQD